MSPQPPTKVCLDVDYRPDCTVTACVGFNEWTDATAVLEKVVRSATPAADYEPGQFARREMPYLIDVLGSLKELPQIIVIDGYVFLDEGKPGLGARLHEALHARAVVVGVAKTRFRGATAAIEVLRGKSKEPLFVDAVGMSREDAVRAVAAMAGPHRVPALLRRADQLARAGGKAKRDP
jgi:deoxyribonuclease V